MFAKNPWIRAVSVFPFAAICCLFAFEWYAYNLVFVPYSARRGGEDVVAVVARTLVFNALWALALWSFLRCSFSDPGFVPPDWQIRAEEWNALDQSKKSVQRPRIRQWQPGDVTMCSKCLEERPERAHHCSVCGRCVLRMDHHCPWVGNCVGFKNHKFFILMTFYGTLACAAYVASALPQLRAIFFGTSTRAMESMMLVTLAGVLAAAFSIALGALFLSHLGMLLFNLTSIEVGYGGRNPYSLGPWHNAQQLFGAWSLTWFLPVAVAHPTVDGLSYPLRDAPASWSKAPASTIGRRDDCVIEV